MPKRSNQKPETGQGVSVEDFIHWDMQNTNDRLPKSIQYSVTKVVRADPHILHERRLVAGMKNDPHSDVFRMLRTNVLRQMRENQWTVLAVTSPTAQAGKSFVSANLAVAMAMELNQTVLAVDADLRHPRLGWYFQLENQAHGLFEYLNQRCELQDILINPGIPRLVLLPGKGTSTQSSELLSSPRMVALTDELKTRYSSRIVLFDLPPVLETDDAINFMPHYDAALLVVEDGKNTQAEITRAMRLLDGTNLLGVVQNKARNVNLQAY